MSPVPFAEYCARLLIYKPVVMFRGSISKWKQAYKVENSWKSEIAEAFEKEMKMARVLIAEQELRRENERGRKSDRTLTSEAVGREEEAIMLKIQRAVSERGWETGTLIHDAVIVQRVSKYDPTEQRKLERAVDTALSEAMEERGWTRGSARAKVTAM